MLCVKIYFFAIPDIIKITANNLLKEITNFVLLRYQYLLQAKMQKITL